MSAALPPVTPTLESVRSAFAHWRANRTRRGQTPPNLQSRAVALMDYHCPAHICKALCINDQALKRWAKRLSHSDSPPPPGSPAEPFPAFIKLAVLSPTEPTTSTALTTVHLHTANGLQLSVNGPFTLAEIVAVASAQPTSVIA